jgi:hypothetical protein
MTARGRMRRICRPGDAAGHGTPGHGGGFGASQCALWSSLMSTPVTPPTPWFPGPIGADRTFEEHRPAGGDPGVETGQGDRFDPRRVTGPVVADHVGDLEMLMRRDQQTGDDRRAAREVGDDLSSLLQAGPDEQRGEELHLAIAGATSFARGSSPGLRQRLSDQVMAFRLLSIRLDGSRQQGELRMRLVGSPRGSRLVGALGLILATAAALCIFAAAAGAATLRVVEGGDDSGDCATAPCATIQYAVDQAQIGDTISLAAGEYGGGVTVETPDLTISGAGPAATEIQGGVHGLNLGVGSGGLTVRDLAIKGATQAGIYTDAPVATVTLEDVDLTADGNYGIDVHNDAVIDDWRLDDVVATQNAVGIRLRGEASNLQISNSHFDHNVDGLVKEDSSGVAGVLDNLSISDSTFDEDEEKGIYVEALEEADLERVSVLGSGTGGGAPVGIDINLKYGDYSGVRIADSTISGSTGPGLAVKARNDAPSYNTVPASLEDLELAGLTVTGNAGAAIELGNAITDASLSGSRVIGEPLGLHSSIDPGPGSTVAAANNWWGCDQGPQAAEANGCSAVVGEVETAPYLLFTAAVAAGQLELGTGTLVTAHLDTNSAGAPVAGVPDGAPISFAAAAGSFSPAGAALLNGTASSIFTPTIAAGDAGIVVGLDNQLVAVPLTVLEPLPAPTPQPTETTSPVTNPPALTPTAAPPVINQAGGGVPKAVPASGQVTIATIGCSAGTCDVATKAPDIKIGGRSYQIKVKAPQHVAAGETAALRVVLPKKVREALAKSGKGRVTVKVTVTAADGTQKAMTVSVVVKSKPHTHGGH